MDLIAKFLFLSGKFITYATGRTILAIIHQSVKFHRHLACKYEELTQVVKPYDNMVELLNARTDDSTIANLNLPPVDVCSQTACQTTQDEATRTLHLDVYIPEDLREKDERCEDMFHVCKDSNGRSIDLRSIRVEDAEEGKETPDIQLYPGVRAVDSEDTIADVLSLPLEERVVAIGPETTAKRDHINTVASLRKQEYTRQCFYGNFLKDCGEGLMMNAGMMSCSKYSHLNHLLSQAQTPNSFCKQYSIDEHIESSKDKMEEFVGPVETNEGNVQEEELLNNVKTSWETFTDNISNQCGPTEILRNPTDDLGEHPTSRPSKIDPSWETFTSNLHGERLSTEEVEVNTDHPQHQLIRDTTWQGFYKNMEKGCMTDSIPTIPEESITDISWEAFNTRLITEFKSSDVVEAYKELLRQGEMENSPIADKTEGPTLESNTPWQTCDIHLQGKNVNSTTFRKLSSSSKGDDPLRFLEMLMKEVQDDSNLINVNQQAFNRLEKKVTQILIQQSLTDKDQVTTKGNFFEVHRNASQKIRKALLQRSRERLTRALTNIEKDRYSNEKRLAQQTDEMLFPSKQKDVLIAKLKHLQVLTKEINKICEMDGMEKFPVKQERKPKKVIIIKPEQLQKTARFNTSKKWQTPTATQVNPEEATSRAPKHSSDHDRSDNVKERLRRMESNLKALKIFEDYIRNLSNTNRSNVVAQKNYLKEKIRRTVERNRMEIAARNDKRTKIEKEAATKPVNAEEETSKVEVKLKTDEMEKEENVPSEYEKRYAYFSPGKTARNDKRTKIEKEAATKPVNAEEETSKVEAKLKTDEMEKEENVRSEYEKRYAYISPGKTARNDKRTKIEKEAATKPVNAEEETSKVEAKLKTDEMEKEENVRSEYEKRYAYISPGKTARNDKRTKIEKEAATKPVNAEEETSKVKVKLKTDEMEKEENVRSEYEKRYAYFSPGKTAKVKVEKEQEKPNTEEDTPSESERRYSYFLPGLTKSDKRGEEPDPEKGETQPSHYAGKPENKRNKVDNKKDNSDKDLDKEKQDDERRKPITNREHSGSSGRFKYVGRKSDRNEGSLSKYGNTGDDQAFRDDDPPDDKKRKFPYPREQKETKTSKVSDRRRSQEEQDLYEQQERYRQRYYKKSGDHQPMETRNQKAAKTDENEPDRDVTKPNDFSNHTTPYNIPYKHKYEKIADQLKAPSSPTERKRPWISRTKKEQLVTEAKAQEDAEPETGPAERDAGKVVHKPISNKDEEGKPTDKYNFNNQNTANEYGVDRKKERLKAIREKSTARAAEQTRLANQDRETRLSVSHRIEDSKAQENTNRDDVEVIHNESRPRDPDHLRKKSRDDEHILTEQTHIRRHGKDDVDSSDKPKDNSRISARRREYVPLEDVKKPSVAHKQRAYKVDDDLDDHGKLRDRKQQWDYQKRNQKDEAHQTDIPTEDVRKVSVAKTIPTAKVDAGVKTPRPPFNETKKERLKAIRAKLTADAAEQARLANQDSTSRSSVDHRIEYSKPQENTTIDDIQVIDNESNPLDPDRKRSRDDEHILTEQTHRKHHGKDYDYPTDKPKHDSRLSARQREHIPSEDVKKSSVADKHPAYKVDDDPDDHGKVRDRKQLLDLQDRNRKAAEHQTDNPTQGRKASVAKSIPTSNVDDGVDEDGKLRDRKQLLGLPDRSQKDVPHQNDYPPEELKWESLAESQPASKTDGVDAHGKFRNKKQILGLPDRSQKDVPRQNDTPPEELKWEAVAESQPAFKDDGVDEHGKLRDRKQLLGLPDQSQKDVPRQNNTPPEELKWESVAESQPASKVDDGVDEHGKFRDRKQLLGLPDQSQKDVPRQNNTPPEELKWESVAESQPASKLGVDGVDEHGKLRDRKHLLRVQTRRQKNTLLKEQKDPSYKIKEEQAVKLMEAMQKEKEEDAKLKDSAASVDHEKTNVPESNIKHIKLKLWKQPVELPRHSDAKQAPKESQNAPEAEQKQPDYKVKEEKAVQLMKIQELEAKKRLVRIDIEFEDPQRDEKEVGMKPEKKADEIQTSHEAQVERGPQKLKEQNALPKNATEERKIQKTPDEMRIEIAAREKSAQRDETKRAVNIAVPDETYSALRKRNESPEDVRKRVLELARGEYSRGKSPEKLEDEHNVRSLARRSAQKESQSIPKKDRTLASSKSEGMPNKQKDKQRSLSTPPEREARTSMATPKDQTSIIPEREKQMKQSQQPEEKAQKDSKAGVVEVHDVRYIERRGETGKAIRASDEELLRKLKAAESDALLAKKSTKKVSRSEGTKSSDKQPEYASSRHLAERGKGAYKARSPRPERQHKTLDQTSKKGAQDLQREKHLQGIRSQKVAATLGINDHKSQDGSVDREPTKELKSPKRSEPLQTIQSTVKHTVGRRPEGIPRKITSPEQKSKLSQTTDNQRKISGHPRNEKPKGSDFVWHPVKTPSSQASTPVVTPDALPDDTLQSKFATRSQTEKQRTIVDKDTGMVTKEQQVEITEMYVEKHDGVEQDVILKGKSPKAETIEGGSSKSLKAGAEEVKPKLTFAERRKAYLDKLRQQNQESKLTAATPEAPPKVETVSKATSTAKKIDADKVTIHEDIVEAIQEENAMAMTEVDTYQPTSAYDKMHLDVDLKTTSTTSHQKSEDKHISIAEDSIEDNREELSREQQWAAAIEKIILSSSKEQTDEKITEYIKNEQVKPQEIKNMKDLITKSGITPSDGKKSHQKSEDKHISIAEDSIEDNREELSREQQWAATIEKIILSSSKEQTDEKITEYIKNEQVKPQEINNMKDLITKSGITPSDGKKSHQKSEDKHISIAEDSIEDNREELSREQQWAATIEKIILSSSKEQTDEKITEYIKNEQVKPQEINNMKDLITKSGITPSDGKMVAFDEDSVEDNKEQHTMSSPALQTEEQKVSPKPADDKTSQEMPLKKEIKLPPDAIYMANLYPTYIRDESELASEDKTAPLKAEETPKSSKGYAVTDDITESNLWKSDKTEDVDEDIVEANKPEQSIYEAVYQHTIDAAKKVKDSQLLTAREIVENKRKEELRRAKFSMYGKPTKQATSASSGKDVYSASIKRAWQQAPLPTKEEQKVEGDGQPTVEKVGIVEKLAKDIPSIAKEQLKAEVQQNLVEQHVGERQETDNDARKEEFIIKDKKQTDAESTRLSKLIEEKWLNARQKSIEEKNAESQKRQEVENENILTKKSAADPESDKVSKMMDGRATTPLAQDRNPSDHSHVKINPNRLRWDSAVADALKKARQANASEPKSELIANTKNIQQGSDMVKMGAESEPKTAEPDQKAADEVLAKYAVETKIETIAPSIALELDDKAKNHKVGEFATSEKTAENQEEGRAISRDASAEFPLPVKVDMPATSDNIKVMPRLKQRAKKEKPKVNVEVKVTYTRKIERKIREAIAKPIPHPAEDEQTKENPEEKKPQGDSDAEIRLHPPEGKPKLKKRRPIKLYKPYIPGMDETDSPETRKRKLSKESADAKKPRRNDGVQNKPDGGLASGNDDENTGKK